MLSPVLYNLAIGTLPALREQYASARPFPHIVIDDFLDPDVASLAAKEFPPLGDDWISYTHINERKFGNTTPDSWGPTLQEILRELQSHTFTAFLEELTGISALLVDHDLSGGGLHQSGRDGFLNIHADFTVHPRHRNWRRRVNLLLYLNERWEDEWGGFLELWSTDMARCEKRIKPVGNRAVIFSTDADSFHGHPTPMTCPVDVARQSLALYYFTEETRPMIRSTEYRARPGDGTKGLGIWADKEILRAYDWAKRRLGISDDAASRILRKLSGRKGS